MIFRPKATDATPKDHYKQLKCHFKFIFTQFKYVFIHNLILKTII